jgi:hypothetical protein
MSVFGSQESDQLGAVKPGVTTCGEERKYCTEEEKENQQNKTQQNKTKNMDVEVEQMTTSEADTATTTTTHEDTDTQQGSGERLDASSVESSHLFPEPETQENNTTFLPKLFSSASLEGPAPTATKENLHAENVASEDSILRTALGAKNKLYNFMIEFDVDEEWPGPMARIGLAFRMRKVVGRLRCSLLALAPPETRHALRRWCARKVAIDAVLAQLEKTFFDVEQVDGFDYNRNRLLDLMDRGDEIRAVAGDEDLEEIAFGEGEGEEEEEEFEFGHGPGEFEEFCWGRGAEQE